MAFQQGPNAQSDLSGSPPALVIAAAYQLGPKMLVLSDGLHAAAKSVRALLLVQNSVLTATVTFFTEPSISTAWQPLALKADAGDGLPLA